MAKGMYCKAPSATMTSHLLPSSAATGAEQCLAQLLSSGGQLRFGLIDALLALQCRLAAFGGGARRQQFVKQASVFPNHLTLRQFITGTYRVRIPASQPFRNRREATFSFLCA
jgi:hypothetical protein